MTKYKSFALLFRWSDVDAAAMDIKFKKRDYKWTKKKLNIHRENHACIKIALQNNTHKKCLHIYMWNQFDFILNSLRISFVYSECSDHLSSCIIHAVPSESLYLRWDWLVNSFLLSRICEQKSRWFVNFVWRYWNMHTNLKCVFINLSFCISHLSQWSHKLIKKWFLHARHIYLSINAQPRLRKVLSQLYDKKFFFQ